MGVLNLEDRLVFGNIALHMIGIPLITSTTLFLLASTAIPPLPLSVPESLQSLSSSLLALLPEPLLTHLVPPPSLATLGALVYLLIYILLDPLAGTLLAPLTLALVSSCHSLAASTSTSGIAIAIAGTTSASVPVRYVAFALWLAAWCVLFVGHGAFEKRAPAMLDDFWGAIVLAPFFVWFECLFFLGYRRELRERVEKRVKAQLEMFKGEEKEKEKEKKKVK